MSGEYDWAASWTADGTISGSNIADAGDATSDEISNDGDLATEVSIEIAYGATANEGVKVYVLRDVDGTNFEAEADSPWGFEMPYSTSTTHRKTFTVPGSISAFVILLTNDSGAQVTATVRTRNAVAAA